MVLLKESGINDGTRLDIQHQAKMLSIANSYTIYSVFIE